VNITVVAVPEYYRGETPLDAETIHIRFKYPGLELEKKLV